jgi:hypothetical protein
MEHPRRIPGFFCIILLVLVCGTVARAEAAGGDPVQKVTALNKKALDEYAAGEFDTARALLKEALGLCNTAGLATHPIKARTHIHLGIVSIVGFKQRDLGIKHFRKALEIQPEIKLTKSLVTPELQDAFEEAMGSPGGGAPAEAAAPAGGDETGGPAAEGDGGGGAPAVAEADDEGGPPKVRRPPPPKKKKKAPSEDEESSSGDDEDEEPAYRIYMAVTLGGGVGVASGSGELNAAHTLKSAGFALAQLGQLSPEVGFFVLPNLMLSLRGRFQYVNNLTGEKGPGCGSDGYCTPGNFAAAGFARATYFFGQAGGFRMFLAGELGAGNIRHAETFPLDTKCGQASNTQCVDTLAGGPFLFGPTVGFMADLGKAAGIVVSLATDVGVPHFTLNFDFNAGMALHF